MKIIEVTGGRALSGSVRIQGSKNAVLPMLAASILTEQKTILTNCPHIQDVYTMLDLLKEIGCRVKFENHVIEIDPSVITACEIKQESARSVRSSVMLLGSLLGRLQRAKLPYPGGCVIGKRPINIHMEMLEKMGVVFEKGKESFTACSNGLKGAELVFYTKSVGAAENCILAAALAQGVTRLKGVAIEPEIMELCSFLRKMGAVILRTDYDEFLIKGVKRLRGVEFRVPPDRIVAGTYMLAAAALRSEIYLEDVPFAQMQSLFSLLKKMGATLECRQDGVLLQGKDAHCAVPYIRTANYPGFPTDLQSQFAAVMTVADGSSVIEETIFEARYKTVLELKKMGADMRVKGRRLYINPVHHLIGAQVKAEELRGGAALVIAGLMAQGKTEILNCHFIERGYEDIVGDFKMLGSTISWK